VRTIVKGKNLDIPPSDKRYAEEKLRRLERLLDDKTDAMVELSMENHRNPARSQIVEVTLVIDGQTVRGEASAASHRAAIDDVMDKLERRALSHKRRPLVRRRTAATSKADAAVKQQSADAGDTEFEPKIVKTKRFAIEPMFEEDALSRMEELDHDFFIFVNAETEAVAVLYRRKDGDYGLIEPDVSERYTQRRSKS
jgi:putative sigma-54 modulation protein